MPIGKFGQKYIPRDDDVLAARRPAAQTKGGAPVTLVDDAIGDKIVVLAMVENRQVEHLGILNRTSHQLVVLDAVAIVGNRDDASLFERTNRRQLFAL